MVNLGHSGATSHFEELDDDGEDIPARARRPNVFVLCPYFVEISCSTWKLLKVTSWEYRGGVPFKKALKTVSRRRCLHPFSPGVMHAG